MYLDIQGMSTEEDISPLLIMLHKLYNDYSSVILSPDSLLEYYRFMWNIRQPQTNKISNLLRSHFFLPPILDN